MEERAYRLEVAFSLIIANLSDLKQISSSYISCRKIYSDICIYQL